MSQLVVEGGSVLQGTIGVLGAKNAVLKEMIAALLAPGRHRLSNVPNIVDVELMCQVLEHIGCRVDQDGEVLSVVTPETLNPVAPIELVRQMRASIVVLGPVVGAVWGSPSGSSRW